MNQRDQKEMLNCSLEIIMHAGNARELCMAAVKKAMLNEMDAANTKLQEARVEFTEAHQSQTKLLTENAQAVSAEKVGIIPDILMVHAQDHFNAAYIDIDFSGLIIGLYQEVNALKEEIKELKTK